MRGVNRAYAGVSVVVGVHAEAEGTRRPAGLRAPVVVVMLEAVHLLREALPLQFGLLPQFALLLPYALLL